mmetsp:Transcript_12654/g.35603  ORF Transcript_12654/g.35603 Transcript_12654/m.35603 type:complete len:654 (-) Transcript_12654:245-2206(-)
MAGKLRCAKGGRGNRRLASGLLLCALLLEFRLPAVGTDPAEGAEAEPGAGNMQASASTLLEDVPAHNSKLVARGSGSSASGSSERLQSETAYVTLCYRESYVLGVRVLGQSIRESGSTMDMVALVTGISSSSQQTLAQDGWIVKPVDLVQNPGTGPTKKGRAGYPPRFWAVYTKLLVFGLTEYSTIIYLDADIMILSNLEHLFACSGFCAVMRVGERFNSGLMVIHPSQEVLSDMMERITTTPSYTGGDQGFLNEYYKSIIDSPLFHPSEPGHQEEATAMRLTTDYNSDIGAYVINGGLWHQKNDPKVLHFTLGPFKPWHWWMSWLTDQHSAWLQVKARLGKDVHGYSGGNRLRLSVGKWILAPLPLLVAVWLLKARAWDFGLKQMLLGWLGEGRHLPGAAARKVKHHPRVLAPHPWTSGGAAPAVQQREWSMAGRLLWCVVLGRGSYGASLGQWGSGGSVLQQPAGLSEVASTVGIAATALSLAATVTLVVPNDSEPTLAWILVYEWTFLGLFLAVTRLLRTCYKLGQAARPHQPDFLNGIHSAGLQDLATTAAMPSILPREKNGDRKPGPSNAVIRAWGTTLRCSLLSVMCIVVSPWASRLFGINDIVAKILITAFSGVFALLVLSHSLGDMATAWFSAGAVGLSIRDVED